MQRRDLAFLPCSFLHHCRKNRETILCIQRQVKIVCIYPGDLLKITSTKHHGLISIVIKFIKEKEVSEETQNFLSWTSTIKQIIQKYYFLVSGKPASRNNSWAFLKSKFLVVPIYCLHENSLIIRGTEIDSNYVDYWDYIAYTEN
jgi:hypothetical protein